MTMTNRQRRAERSEWFNDPGNTHGSGTDRDGSDRAGRVRRADAARPDREQGQPAS